MVYILVSGNLRKSLWVTNARVLRVKMHNHLTCYCDFSKQEYTYTVVPHLLISHWFITNREEGSLFSILDNDLIIVCMW